MSHTLEVQIHNLGMFLVGCLIAFVAFAVGYISGTHSSDLEAYQEGQQACMDWYNIDPYAEEAEAHGL